MAQRLTFLGRVSSRWRVRIEIPEDLCVQGLTVGLWGEDGRPLAPSVVVPHVGAGVIEAEVGGPAALPAGTEVRCIADVVGAEPITVAVGTDRRRGLHAFLHADLRLPVSSNELAPMTLGRQDKERLARAYPWVAPGRVAVADPPAADDVLSMLRDDFGVDLDDMDEDLLAALKDRDP
jgi:hypothetical protein